MMASPRFPPILYRRHCSMALPREFPQVAPPIFQDGDRVRWLPLADDQQTDQGTIIGHCFAYAHHRRHWAWQYLVWLDEPHGEAFADTAWEEDLELLN